MDPEEQKNQDEQVLNESSRLKGNRGELDWIPVRPGTIRLKVTGTILVCEDDSKGNLVSAGVSVGTVDYKTGKVVFNGPVGEMFEASYYFDAGPPMEPVVDQHRRVEFKVTGTRSGRLKCEDQADTSNRPSEEVG